MQFYVLHVFHRGVIYKFNLETGNKDVFYNLGYSVEGMTFVNGKLYFTVSNNGSIAVLNTAQCQTGECQPTVLKTGLESPRGIAVDNSEKLANFMCQLSLYQELKTPIVL